MNFLATAKCPTCKWKLSLPIDFDGSLEESLENANSIVDPLLIDHLKSHSRLKKFLSEAGAVPDKTTNNFRGSFDLKYREIKKEG